MTFSQIEHGSEQYQQELALRDEVLRRPLGLKISDDDLSREPHQWHFGLFKEESIIACVIAVPRSDTEAQIRQMAVSADFQGMGLGRKIMQQVEEALQKKGTSRLFLHARVPVIDFYRKLGYSPSGDIFEEVGIPHQKMQKLLGDC